jgi:cob(I)alamin adenosyltransferase
MGNLEKGFVQVYTGNGKGKSTAAIGQAVRAAGHGLKTYMLQLMKDYPYGEIESLNNFNDLIEVDQVCSDDWVFDKKLPGEDEKIKALNALNDAKEKMLSGKYNLVILDEAIVSIYFKLIGEEIIIDFIKSKPDCVELILTGRYCPENIIKLADLVTEMTEVKHYYKRGVLSRKGIES